MRNRSMGISTGDHATGGTVEERLARRFAVELVRAERDYPRLRRLADREEGRSFRRSWPRLQTVVIAAAALTIAGLVAMSFAWRGQGGPAASGSMAAGSGQTGWPHSSGLAIEMEGLVINGLPTQVNGELVYQLWQQDKWRVPRGSFSLAGYKWAMTNACPTSAASTTTATEPTAEGRLIPVCDGVELSPTPGNYTKDALELAPMGSEVLASLPDGTAVVVRVHVFDPLASECAAPAHAACYQAVVVEDIAWQRGPGSHAAPDWIAFENALDQVSLAGGKITAVDGMRVYGSDESLPTTGSFLVGGSIVRSPASCPATPATSGSIVWPSCGQWTFAGYQMVQSSAVLDPLIGHLVVLRVYGAGGSTACLNGQPYCRVLAAVEVVLVAS